MSAVQVLFILVAGLTLYAALMVVSVRRLMHAAFWLILVLLGVAVLFVMLQAGFFAMVQLLVYIGAISILIIFAVMLTRQVMNRKAPQFNRTWWIGLATAVGMLTILTVTLLTSQDFMDSSMGSPDENLVAALGRALADPHGYAIPFEVASILLVVALIGTIFIALERKGGAR